FQGAPDSAPRLPRVSVRLPLRLLRRYPAQLHPDAQPDPVRLPAQHASARSVHAQPQSGHAHRDLVQPPYIHQLRHDDPAGAVQEGPGHLPEDPGARHLSLGAEEQSSGVERTGYPVQHPPDERAGVVRRHASDRVHPKQIAHAEHVDHRSQRAHGHLPELGRGLGHGGTLPVPQRYRKPTEVSEQPHPLLLVHFAVSVRRSEHGSDPRADHEGAAGAIDREPAAPLGAAHHLHRAHQEPHLPILAARVRPLRARNRKVIRISCKVLYGEIDRSSARRRNTRVIKFL
ncbi:unnamed protein product, partial [Callosobruchus maculatus]